MNSVLSLWFPLLPSDSPRSALGLPLAVVWGPFGERLGHIGNFIETLDALYRELYQIHEPVKKKTQLFGICPRSARKWCQQVLLRPSLPYALGVRMTGVKQTPSN